MNQPEQDLAFIRRLMDETQQTVADNGSHFLVWGLLAPVGLVLTWLYAEGRPVADPRLVWGAVLVVGWGLSLWLGMRGSGRARVRTGGRRVLGVVWLSCAVTMTLVALAGLLGSVVPMESLAGLMAALMGLGIVATGVLTGTRWLAGVGGAWWAGAGVMLFVPGTYVLLLLAAMALLLELVPGMLLYTRSRRTVIRGS